ncbi:hypothetical protein Glove_202g44 [Diversispora epigaea]|uniref:Uncharacterized protein n=1 Tax=Diversispora epigaea TaxID=1348612 RepID=A0A397IQW2_9GLOM|nr:hypothetical protein Glove_202g44 [Diversispora epigaea]
MNKVEASLVQFPYKVFFYISPRSLNTYHNNIPKKAIYKSLSKNIDNITFLENIIESDSKTIAYQRNIMQKLQRHKNLIVYTDGSLKKNKYTQFNSDNPDQQSMGFGVVYETLQHFTWKGKIEGPPSSTRAELWGILSVIWMASHKTTTIKELIYAKDLTVDLEKIEAHRGYQYNEQADNLAKAGADSGSTFSINIRYIKEQQFHFKWNGKDVDAGIKEFIKKTTEVTTSVSWFTQYRTYSWLNQNIRQETNWQYSQQIWHGTKITNNRTNSKDSSLRAFSLKLLNEELPTKVTLNLRKPDIYTDNQCPFCNSYKETNSHVFMCGNQGKILKTAFRSIIKKAYFKEKGNKDLTDFMRKINRGHFMKINYNRQVNGTQLYLPPKFEIQMPKSQMPKSQIPNPKSQIIISIFCRNPKSQIPNTSNLCILASQIPNYLEFGQHVYTQSTDRFEFNDLVRGLIPKSIYRLTRRKLNSAETTKNMILNIFREWKMLLYDKWKNRCKEFLTWEKENNIMEIDKKVKGKRAPIDPNYIKYKKHLATIGKNIIKRWWGCSLSVKGQGLTGPIPLQSILLTERSKVNSTEVSRNIVFNIFREWKILLYNRWKTKCKDFLVWEDQNKIRECDKRSKDLGGAVASQ